MTIEASGRLGIVVIGRNEGERLRSCLDSIGKVHPLVYVDSGSSDSSVSIADGCGASIVQLDGAIPFTAARARNEGLTRLLRDAPDADFVQFIDGDCELVDGWLDGALAFLLKRHDVAVVCGRRRERHPAASVYNRLCDLEWNTRIGEAGSCGGDAMMRVAAIRAAGGFNGKLIAGEEPELCLRLRARGWRIWRLDLEMTRHDAAITRFSQWWRRALRGGYGAAEVAHLHNFSRSCEFTSQVVRAAAWGGVLPTALVLGAAVHPVALAGLSIYALQVARVASRRPPPDQVPYAFFNTLAKFPEFFGAMRYWCSDRTKRGNIIEYKR